MSIDLNLEKKIITLVESFNKGLFDDVLHDALNTYQNNKNIPILPNLIGASYAGINNHKKAIFYYNQALKLDSKNAELFNNLGKSQLQLNSLDEALSSFLNSKNIDKNNYDTLLNIGLIYYEKKSYEEALENYFNAIKINNKFDKLYYNTALVLSKLGRKKEAIKYFELTLKINNKHIKALNNLATEHINGSRYDQALNYLNQAIESEPFYAKAYNNLGIIYLKKKNFDLALRNFSRAYDIDNNLAIAGIQKHFIKRTFCDWSNKDELDLILKKSLESNQQISPWFCLSFEDNARNHYTRAKNFSRQYKLLQNNNNIYNNNKIRIGYYASDFHEHPGMVNMAGIFANHNKKEFEIIGFYYGDINKDKTHYKIKKYFDKFFYVDQLDDIEILNLSIENKIDIAIYRAGLTNNARSSIFSNKVAPIQINFLAYPGTTGQEGVDYIISDKFVIPENQQKYYSEKIIYLTNCYYPRDNTRQISSTIFNRQEAKIPKESFVYCSFNNSYKITFDEFNIWLKILKKVPNSILLLLRSNDVMVKNLKVKLIENNIDINRIIFFDKIDFEDHLSRLSLADLFLDSFNYNAHTSAVDALWTGLPILTKVGNSFSSRICASLLKYFRLDELVTNTDEDYLEKAVELGLNSGKYNEIKNKLEYAKESGEYFDTKKYTFKLEEAYKKVHFMRIKENKVANIFIEEN